LGGFNKPITTSKHDKLWNFKKDYIKTEQCEIELMMCAWHSCTGDVPLQEKLNHTAIYSHKHKNTAIIAENNP
jgi:hypothetical protein